MASPLQVQDTLLQLVESVVYPNGIVNPSVVGVDVRITAGWPIKNKLDADLKAGKAQVSVFPMGGMGKNTTRFPKVSHTVSINTPTLTVAVLNNTVTIGGIVTLPQGIGITYNKVYYGYSAVSGDTLDTIATNLAALIPGASAVGSVITLSNVINLSATVVVNGFAAYESKRQTHSFYVSIWAPTPVMRDNLATAIDNYLGNIERFNLPDNTGAVIISLGFIEIDAFQLDILYKRDLVYQIEYATIITNEYTVIGGIFADLTLEQCNG